MNRKEKENFVAELSKRLKSAQGTFLVEYKGLDVEAMNQLRKGLKSAGSEIQVVKNRLLKLASRDTETAMIEEHMKGPSAIAVAYDDVVGPAKILVDLAADFEQLKIKGGQISGNAIDAGAIKRLAELPGRETLLAQSLCAMQAVPTSLVRVLNGVMVKLLNVFKAIEAQKEA